ncbi:MAG: hypothetical protein C4K49_05605 [Candidatus Thorarchaeota archaeon]|nr:MAG: hypothetical protein C4K49_05605 [Candidatus Thorarchaeota archaeon]
MQDEGELASTVSTRYAFHKQAIKSFEKETGAQIRLNRQQETQLETESRVSLLVAQISDVVHDLLPDRSRLFEYVKERTKHFQPISMSLFVLNDETWKLMQKKSDYADRMLPMATIPWFHWEPAAISKANPLGARRAEGDISGLSVDERESTMFLSGQGGNYCGLVEARIVRRLAGMRPILIPGTLGDTNRVPQYELQELSIKMATNESDCHLYPVPEKTLDYSFSESPKVFYEHGLRLEADGASVLLKVGNRRKLALRGHVRIFLGKPFPEDSVSSDVLAFHVWLNSIKECVELMGGGPRPVASL